jgi:extracellular matrix regulatory protein A
MDRKLLNVGFGNMVMASRVVAIVTPSSAPTKRLKEEAKEARKLIDVTQGRKTRSIIVTDSDHIVLSAVEASTVANRLLADAQAKLGEGKE